MINIDQITPALPLQTGCGNTSDKRPLRQEKQDQHRQHDQRGCRHQLVPRRIPGLALQELQSQRQRKLILVRQVDQRPDQIVPDRQKVKQRDDGQRRLG